MKRALSIALLLLLQQAVFSQSNKTDFGYVLSRMESARKNRPVENIYLHFDKPYYASGDTMYFKAYLTLNEQHRLSLLSEVLHVDLIDPKNRIIHSLRVKLKQGMAGADLPLPDSLPAGNYRIRAYTRWMLNEGDGNFFQQRFPIGSARRQPRQTGVSAVVSRSGGPDTRFFPEGGELLAGVESKVAFKTTANNGLGIKVKGIVVDNDGKEITRFQSVHLGMGIFYLKPEEGKTYQAKLTFGDGSTATADLPKPALKGMTLDVEDSVIHVVASAQYFKEHQNEIITLLVYSYGAPSVTRAKLTAENMPFSVDKPHLHSGILRITLFSSQLEPISERLLFIKNPDQMTVQVKSDKPVYTKREKVQISLSTRDQASGPAAGNFSVAIVNDDIIHTDEDKENSILAGLLLTPEIKGTIEQPNYYFAHSGDEVDANLDLLMLTQGYRHFVWKEVLHDSLPPLAYKAEKFLQLQGAVRTLSGKPVKNEVIVLADSSGRGPELKETTNSEGRFVFTNLDFTDTMHFTLTPAKQDSRIVLSNYPGPVVSREDTTGPSSDVNGMMPGYLRLVGQQQENRGNPEAKVLKTVTVKAIRVNNNIGSGNADQVVHASDLHGGGQLADQLNGRLLGVSFLGGTPILTSNMAMSALGRSEQMLVVVDGVEMSFGNISDNDSVSSAFNINEINLNDVETIEVLKSASGSIYGVGGGNGVLLITTKSYSQDLDVEDSPDPNVLEASVVGFYKTREFYSPTYVAPRGADPTRDLRTTVVWKPEVITDKAGNASFSFYNSDVGGTYRVVVEGIGANGSVGREVYKYKVQ